MVWVFTPGAYAVLLPPAAVAERLWLLLAMGTVLIWLANVIPDRCVDQLIGTWVSPAVARRVSFRRTAGSDGARRRLGSVFLSHLRTVRRG